MFTELLLFIHPHLSPFLTSSCLYLTIFVRIDLLGHLRYLLGAVTSMLGVFKGISKHRRPKTKIHLSGGGV